MGWDTDLYERELSKHDGIASIGDLEEVLGAYVDDVSLLGSESKLDW